MKNKNSKNQCNNKEQKTTITLMHQNVVSITNKTEFLEELISVYNINLLCVTEHWLEKSCLEIINFPDFKLMAQYCRQKDEHGGNAVYLSDDIIDKYDVIEIDFKFANVNRIIESCGIKIHNQNNKTTELIVICMYRPPIDKYYDIFLDKLDEIGRKLKLTENPVVICGDLNINHLDKSTRKYKKLNDILESYKLVNHINEVTRPKSNTGLDYIIMNAGREYKYIEVINSNISDHKAQMIKYEIKDTKSKTEKKTKVIQKRYYNRKENEEKMYRILQNTEWTFTNEEVSSDKDIDRKWQSFMTKIYEIHDESYPKINIKINPKIKRQKWLTEEIRKNGRELREMKQNLITNSEIIKQKKREHIKNIRKAKRDIYNN
uniref:Endonuclease/exonuclease/phosphatase domain-containing protein n=1 Tax=Cacopsylla melanoneura TaxID=428564 RepID=A0A8D8U3J0_9HEMI